LSNEVLYKLYNFVKKHAPMPNDSPEPAIKRVAPASAPSSRPKKNKPMSKSEQEAQIAHIRGQLSGLDQNGDEQESGKQFRVYQASTMS
jgi:bromodomain-containing factor 1